MSTDHNDLHVLYCDNHVISVVKPAGVLSQGDHTGDPSILDECKHWIKRQYKKPGNVFLGLVHRLDRPVSGVMVFGRTSKGASRLSESFRARTVEKIYLALVHGHLTEPATLRGDMDGKACALHYAPLQQSEAATLLMVRPDTGRKHQIRRQLSGMGHPIIGDVKYGSPQKMAKRRIGLHAHRITIPHPTTRNPLVLTAPRPDYLPASRWPQIDAWPIRTQC